MTKRKTTKKKAIAKTQKPVATETAKAPKSAAAVPAKAQEKPEKKAARTDLCVFAFRLTAEERDAIHKAAGPGKASMFARGLLVAAARKDETALNAIVKHWNPDSR